MEEVILRKVKKFLCLMLAGALSLSLAACGAGAPKVDYDAEFDTLMERIEDLGEKADFVSTVNIVIWQETGPEDVAAVLASMLTAKEFDDLRSQGDIRVAFDTSRDSEAWTYVERYQEEYTAVSTGMETLEFDK